MNISSLPDHGPTRRARARALFVVTVLVLVGAAIFVGMRWHAHRAHIAQVQEQVAAMDRRIANDIDISEQLDAAATSYDHGQSETYRDLDRAKSVADVFPLLGALERFNHAKLREDRIVAQLQKLSYTRNGENAVKAVFEQYWGGSDEFRDSFTSFHGFMSEVARNPILMFDTSSGAQLGKNLFHATERYAHVFNAITANLVNGIHYLKSRQAMRKSDLRRLERAPITTWIAQP